MYCSDEVLYSCSTAVRENPCQHTARYARIRESPYSEEIEVTLPTAPLNLKP